MAARAYDRNATLEDFVANAEDKGTVLRFLERLCDEMENRSSKPALAYMGITGERGVRPNVTLDIREDISNGFSEFAVQYNYLGDKRTDNSDGVTLKPSNHSRIGLTYEEVTELLALSRSK